MITLDYKSIFEICIIHSIKPSEIYTTSGFSAEGVSYEDFIKGYNKCVESLNLPYKVDCGDESPYFIINEDHTATWYNKDGTVFE